MGEDHVKIAHVVTYISPDGAFGGPVRVALGQAEALAERGHEVTVYAAAPPNVASTTRQDGYTLKTFPARRVAPVRGFAAMSAPQLTNALKTDAHAFDVAHIHLARDLVTIPAARVFRKAGVPYVLQPHGMIDASDNLLATPLDVRATKPLLRNAAAVLTLTQREDEEIRKIESSSRTRRITNGIRLGALEPYEGRDNVVMYLARLAQRKRPTAFVEMAQRLRDSLPDTQFVIAGPDEGEGDAVRSAISRANMGNRLEWIGPVSPDDTQRLLSSARAYVLPAFNEVFPMSILEAMRAGTPVVTTDSLGIASACHHHGAAVITDGSPGELAQAVEAILTVDGEAQRLREGASIFLRQELDIAHVATALESTYAQMATSADASSDIHVRSAGNA